MPPARRWATWTTCGELLAPCYFAVSGLQSAQCTVVALLPAGWQRLREWGECRLPAWLVASHLPLRGVWPRPPVGPSHPCTSLHYTPAALYTVVVDGPSPGLLAGQCRIQLCMLSPPCCACRLFLGLVQDKHRQRVRRSLALLLQAAYRIFGPAAGML